MKKFIEKHGRVILAVYFFLCIIWLLYLYIDIDQVVEDGDAFGALVVSADFNGDGYSDFVVASPGEKHKSNRETSGALNIFYGGNERVDPVESDFWDLHVMWRDPRSLALVTGDFNGDGFSDLAIGNERYSSGIEGTKISGTVALFYGKESGLEFDEPQHLTRFDVQPDIDDALKFSTGFGERLAVGDFNNDGYSDLAVGSITSGSIRTEETYGNLFLLYGSQEGVTGKQSQVWSIDKVPLPEGVTIDNENRLDYANNFAAGDIDGDGFDDLFVGVGRGFSENYLAQAHLLFGSPSGIRADQLHPWPSQEISESTGFKRITPEHLISIQDLNQDGYGDIFFSGTGVLVERGRLVEGMFYVPGRKNGPADKGIRFWPSPFTERAEFVFYHSQPVAMCDFNGDGNLDVAFGLPVAEAKEGRTAQEIPLIYGPFSGPSHTESLSQRLNFDEDFFGDLVVACGDINNDGYSDLLLGRHDVEVAEMGRAGVVDIYYGSAQGLPQDYQTRLHQVVDWRVGFGRWRGW